MTPFPALSAGATFPTSDLPRKRYAGYISFPSNHNGWIIFPLYPAYLRRVSREDMRNEG